MKRAIFVASMLLLCGVVTASAEPKKGEKSDKKVDP